MHRPLIVGDRADGHVRAVLDAIDALGGPAPLVFDGPSLQRDGFSVTLDRITHAGVTAELGDGQGWLRRYAPTEWGIGTVAGSLDAAVRRSFLALIGSVSRLGSRRWLTSLGPLLNGEDKLVQVAAARHLGVRAPATVVTSDGHEAAHLLGRFVVKPLTGGYFVHDDTPRAVFTGLVDPGDIDDLNFGHAPFLAQEAIVAVRHLRVVTVQDRAWTASLDATGLPLDWRADDAAHRSWTAGDEPEVEASAVRLTKHLELGYSSQDWIVDGNGPVFIELNPAGQWMFLPDPVASRVTDAIARFLVP